MAEESKGRKGRGAVGNPTGRFERFQVERDPGEDPPAPLRTIVTPEVTRTIITRNDSPDIPFDRSINPYKGCEHGCIYCFARPTHAYLGLSPGLDFETRIFSKPDAAARLREELRRPGYRCEVMALGSNTDPYQPAERKLRITRGVLETLAEHDHPVGIVTKSTLVLRDLDILVPMAARNLVRVMLSVTTLRLDLARRMEPRAAPPRQRIETIRALTEAKVPAGVLVSPVIPGLTDGEMERILEAAAAAGAGTAGWILLRLPLEVKELFEAWLGEHEPLRAAHVLNLVRATREGKLNQPEFGRRMRGTGPYAELLRRRFQIACRRLGLDQEGPQLDTTRFRVPPRPGDQGTLFPS
ncbi:MAG TPA: PA0069 family radical SAM protein [Candidatus Polarisedimenticolia bacterium]|jgi:DNA repair photolyase